MRNKRHLGLVLMTAFAFLLTGIISVKAEAKTEYVQDTYQYFINYDEGLKLTSESKNKYDKKGNLVSTTDTYYDYYDPVTYTFGDTATKKTTKYKYTRNKDGQITKVTINGKKSTVNTYKGGKLVKSQYYSNGKLRDTETYTYKNGKLKKSLIKRKSGYCETTYDKYENRVKYVDYAGTGKNKIKNHESIYKYKYKKGLTSELTSISKTYSNGVLSTASTDHYIFYTSGFQKGRIKSASYKTETYDSTGALEYTGDSSINYEYKADKTKKNVAECTEKDGVTGKVGSITKYTYKKINK